MSKEIHKYNIGDQFYDEECDNTLQILSVSDMKESNEDWIYFVKVFDNCDECVYFCLMLEEDLSEYE